MLKRRRLRPTFILLLIALFAGITSFYLLMVSEAQVIPRDPPYRPDKTYDSDIPKPVLSESAGTVQLVSIGSNVYDLRLFADIPKRVNVSNESSQASNPDQRAHLYLSLSFDARKAIPQSITCGVHGDCSSWSFNSTGYADPERAGYKKFFLCFDPAENNYGKAKQHFATLRFTSTSSKSYTFSYIATWEEKLCKYQNDYTMNGTTGTMTGTVGYAGPPGPPGNRDSGSGSGNIGDGSGAGGAGNSGGGGSSAITQSDKPNALPSSSSQGEVDQQELKPSPFFDGKEFERGSDGDIKAASFSSTAKKMLHKWFIVTPILIVIAAAGYAIWFFRRHKKLIR